jgi:hypothetical protein
VQQHSQVSAPVLLSVNCFGFSLRPPFLLANNDAGKQVPPVLWHLDAPSRTFRQLDLSLGPDSSDEEKPYFSSVGSTQRQTSWAGGRYAVDAERGLLLIVTTVHAPDITANPLLGYGTLHILHPLQGRLVASTPIGDCVPFYSWIMRAGVVFGGVQRYDRGREVVVWNLLDGALSALSMPARDLQTEDEDNFPPIPVPAHLTPDGSLVAVAEIPDRATCLVLRWNGPDFLDGQKPDVVLRLDQSDPDDSEEDQGMCRPQHVQILDETTLLLSIETRDDEWNDRKKIAVYALDTTAGLGVLWLRTFDASYEAGSIYDLTVLPEMRAIVVVGADSTHEDSAFIEVWDAATGHELPSTSRLAIPEDLNGGVKACSVRPNLSGRLALVIVYGNGQMTVLAFEDYLQHGLSRTNGMLTLRGDPLPDGQIVRGADIGTGIVIRQLATVSGLDVCPQGDLQYVTWDLA